MNFHKVFYLFILAQIQCFCQSNYTIVGTVIDNETQEPIPYVYVRVMETEKYFITDSVGNFKFNNSNINFDFRFGHLNYNQVAIITDTLKKTETNLTLIFKLQKKENTLSEIVISTKTEITNPASNIIDYNFMDSNIVILNYKKTPYKSEIAILNEHLDTLNVSKLHFEPKSLFKDCFGNIHILSTDSSYQIFYQNYNLYVYPPYPISELEKKLGNCYTSTNEFIYFIQKKGAIMITNTVFHDFLSKNNALNYFYINKSTKTKNILFEVIDKKHEEERKKDNEAERIAKMTNTTFKSPVIFRETILLDEIYAPLFIVNDSIIVFDFINDEINIFKNNTVILKTKIDFHRKKTWKRLMIFDEIEKKTYSKYVEKDKLIIKEINYISGEVGKTFSLPYLCFNIKIMNGKAYYLLKNNNDNRFSITLNRIFIQ